MSPSEGGFPRARRFAHRVKIREVSLYNQIILQPDHEIEELDAVGEDF